MTGGIYSPCEFSLCLLRVPVRYDRHMDDEVGVTVVDLTPDVVPVTPETAEERRIRLKAEVIREEWRERDDDSAQCSE
jgi:uncharacterized protein YbbK (DUF523 family)